ncbi:MAG: branched-chain amino acid ABC transporter permease [Candidatus Rokubacteria bacterium]|nr:branched-chain amino acid ABC transporter permease [Candidatus Rokubacteria bacterium]
MGRGNAWRKRLANPMWAVFLMFALFPYIPYIGRYISLGTEVVIWSLFALGFNILLGYTGLPSFGHGAFFGIGAYAAGIYFLRVSKGLWGPLFMSALIAGIAAALIGFLVAKKRGIYFALITIAVSQVFYFIAFRWDDLTGGETGLSGIDRMDLGIPGLLRIDLSPPLTYYYFVLAIFILCTLLIWRIVHSPFGRVLQAMRENELRASYLGYHTAAYKWAAFVVSGLFSGLAGGLYTLLINSAFAFVLDWTQSGNVVMMTLLGGGTVNFFGPVLGAAIFIVSRDLLSAYWESWMLLYGLIFVVVILFIPSGILGLIGGRKQTVLR